MKSAKRFSLSVFLLMPLYVFAHGQEALIILVIPAITACLFLIFLNAVQLRTKSKGILFGVYALSVILSFSVTAKWPYNGNEELINLILGFGPPVVALIIYFIIKRWEKSLRREKLKSFLDKDLMHDGED